MRATSGIAEENQNLPVKEKDVMLKNALLHLIVHFSFTNISNITFN